MKNSINIKGHDQIFTYVIEYIKGTTYTDSKDVNWYMCEFNKDTVHLFEGDVKYFRHKNDWYKNENLKLNHQYIPENSINTSKVRIYIPNHSVSTYKRAVKYAVNVNTWINGYKIDLGSFVFKPSDAVANNSTLKYGNNEYVEYVEFDIIDPFYITYSDDWTEFRNKICKEPLHINSTGSLMCVSMYVIDDYDDRYIMSSIYTGGMTNFNISNDIDYLTLNISEAYDPQGFKLQFNMNSEYNSILDYLKETYGLNTSYDKMKIEVVIKNKDSVIVGSALPYGANEDYGKAIQYAHLTTLKQNESIKTFFKSWNSFEEGWNFAISFNVLNDFSEEIFSVISNELPITQELFSRFINGSEKIIDLKDMNIIQYNVVNKINNEIVHLERPNDSKSNIVQPVFFRVKDTEVLTLHPTVTENICINLDDYKSKVNKFILQIDNCRFDQIGSNKYGILFKITGNRISNDINSGIYYILNENLELVTTGKYTCAR